MGLETRRHDVPVAPAPFQVILLDTNAIIWLVRGHGRVRTLLDRPGSLRVSPASLLELQLLAECGRIRVDLRAVVDDDRWELDDPPAFDWFQKATEDSWTRDPFDRLIAAHARVRRWRLATSDERILERLRPSERFAL